MGRYDIQVRNLKYQTAKDAVIEILINEQPKHDSAGLCSRRCLAILLNRGPAAQYPRA